jgi:putative peptidoglycan lipid II flippase
MAFAAILGSGRFDDAYQLANTIPNIIYEFIMGGLLSAIFIPVLVREQERSGKDSPEAWRCANLLLGYVGLILAVISVAAIVLAPQVVSLMTFLAKDHHAETSRELATYFFRFFAPQMFFYGLSAVFMAVLNSHNVFAITAAAPIINNLVVIATLFAYWFGLVRETGLAVGTTAGIAAMALIQAPWLLRIRMPVRPQFNFRDPLFRSVTALGLPVLGVAAANLLGTAVRSNLLYTVSGGFTTYTFCFILIMMPYGIFAVSIATVLYPTLSRHAADQNKQEFIGTMSLGLRWTLLAMLPVSLGMACLAEPITRVLFERGQFSYANSLFTSRFLAFYALSILPYSLLIFGTRVFYSMKDTVTPTWVNVSGVVLNILLNFALMAVMGIPGIALSSAITYLCTAVATFVFARRVLGRVGGRALALSAGKTLVAGAVMSLVLLEGLRMTRPEFAILEKGSRFPGYVSAAYDAGARTVIATPAALADFWSLLNKDGQLPPRIDFKRSRVVAVFAPRSSTTVTLDLAKAELLPDGAAAFLLDTRKRTPTPMPGETVSNPAYMLIEVRSPVADAQVRFRATDAPPPGRLVRLLRAPDAMRLVFLAALGGIVYVLAGWGLRIEEIRSFARAICSRIKPKGPSARA